MMWIGDAMTRRGFTLMELLMVIGIILLLIGLLIPAISIAQTQAKRAKCLALIKNVETACDLYRNLNGAVPDSLEMNTIFFGGTSPPAAVAVTSITPAQWSTVANELLLRLQTADNQDFGRVTVLNDPWGQVLRYRPCQYYPFSQTPPTSPTSGQPILIDGTTPPNPDTFQIWSCAQNLRDDEGQTGTDDLVNWSH
jgi:prepilin-type N-terminal cleavage/methylation domain-containing protein